MIEQRDVTRVREACYEAANTTDCDALDVVRAVVEACGFDWQDADVIQAVRDDDGNAAQVRAYGLFGEDLTRIADAIALLLRAAGKDEGGTR